MLFNIKLDKIFWAKSIEYAYHLMNHLFSITIEKKTPKEMWSGHPTRDYMHMKVFEYLSYYHM